MDRWRRMVRAQGGDPDAALPVARHIEEVRAGAAGTVERVDALAVGVAASRLGAGRERKDEPVSAAAGIVLRVLPGDRVTPGQVVAELHADDEDHLEAGRAAFAGAVRLGDAARPSVSRVIDRIDGS
jgi:thymidine phosphorylase